jgi:hypothetical protein
MCFYLAFSSLLAHFLIFLIGGLSLHTLLPLRTWSGMCLPLEGPVITSGGRLCIGQKTLMRLGFGIKGYLIF